MNRLTGICFALLIVSAIVARIGLSQTLPLTDKTLLQYASKSYDKEAHNGLREVLGTLNNAEVVADFICSDLCPNYTVRIIHFNVEPGVKCSAVGGVEKSVMIPVSIAATLKAFCFPRVLIDNWDAYVR
jgi:hypothetical protein